MNALGARAASPARRSLFVEQMADETMLREAEAGLKGDAGRRSLSARRNILVRPKPDTTYVMEAQRRAARGSPAPTPRRS